MALRQEHKTLTDSEGNEHKYFVIQKPARQGELLKFNLIKILAPIIKTVKKLTTDKGKVDPEQALEAFGNAIQSLFTTSDPEVVLDFLQSLVINVTRDEIRISASNFDEMYNDNMMEFYAACLFVLEVNFGNFFKGFNLGSTLNDVKNLAR